MQIHKGENLPSVTWPDKKGGSNVELSCNKTRNTDLGVKFFPTAMGSEGWYMMSKKDETVSFQTTDAELFNGRTQELGNSYRLSRDPDGTVIMIEDKVVQNTRVDPESAKKVVTMIEKYYTWDMQEKCKKSYSESQRQNDANLCNEVFTVTEGNCEDQLKKHRDWMKDVDSSHRRRTALTSEYKSKGKVPILWKRSDKENVFYYTLTCTFCKKGVHSINSTKVAISLAEHEYRLGERDQSAHDTLFKAKKEN